jgi:sugar/nucleoside kinase (ribokinase family)
VIGDCNPDLILRGGDLEPAFGQAERLVDGADLVVGGSAAIVACGAARLGLRTALIAGVGDDTFGRFMLDELAARGVDTRGCITVPGMPTGVSVVLAREDDRAILTARGAIGSLSAGLIDRAVLLSARHVHVASYFLQPQLQPKLAGLLREARAAGLTSSVDPNWDPSGAWDSGLRALLTDVDVFLPNEGEAMRLTGEPEAAAAARALSMSGALIVCKRGPHGALAVRGDGSAPVVAPAPVTVHAVDATGAGDCFDAGFLAGQLAGWPLERSLALANACGALSTRALGGTWAQPTMEEALALLAGLE